MHRFVFMLFLFPLCAQRLPQPRTSLQSTISLSAASSTSVLSTPVVLTATVTPTGATGLVTFYAGVTPLGEAVLKNGSAQTSTLLLPTGSASLHAYYGGDATYAPSTSALVTHTVTAAPSEGLTGVTGYPLYGNIVLVAADFNNDGILDLASPGGDHVFLGNGKGGFVPAAGKTPGGNTFVAGDFNGDGNVDLAATGTFSPGLGIPGMPGVQIWLGDGTGGFTLASTISFGVEPWELAVGDFNGDGKPDLVVADAMANNLTVLLGDGTGNFTTALGSPYAAGTDPWQIALGDFNNDGNTDIAVANGESSNVTVLLGDGLGGFTPAAQSPFTVGSQANYLAAGDLRGLGNTDLVISSAAGITVLLADGTGKFNPAPGSPFTGAGVYPVAIGDMNGDGKLDIAAAMYSEGRPSGIYVLLGDGNGNFSPWAGKSALTVKNQDAALIIADFNGDGRADVALVAGYAIGPSSMAPGTEIWFGGVASTTTLSASPNPVVYGSPVSLIATVSPATATGTVVFYDGTTIIGDATLTNGVAKLTVATLSVGSHSLSTLYLGDLVDASSTATATEIVNGLPSLGFTPWPGSATFPTGNVPYSVTTGDFNGDGKPDIAVTNLYDNTVTVLLQSGKSFVAASSSPFATGQAPISVVAGDVNLDGKPDLVIANLNDSTVSVLQGSGNGNFVQNVSATAVGYNPAQLALADFNHDGNVDLVSAGANTEVSMPSWVGLGDGTGKFIPPTQPTIDIGGVGATSVALGDFNGDGIADYVLALPQYGLCTLLGHGDGTFAPGICFSTSMGAYAVAVADFNRDGIQDLAVVNIDTNAVHIYLGDGSGSFTEVKGSPYATGPAPSFVATLDFNGDGLQDLAIVNSGDNTVSILLGDGAGHFSKAGGSPFAVGYAPVSLAVADFNGDGKADLVVANSGDNTVTVLLGAGAPPFGYIDTPTNNSTNLAGAVNVTGWALSTSTVAGVAIYREALPNEPTHSNGLVFISNAYLLPGSRPDVAAQYPTYPNNNWGWGVQLLTNELPGVNGQPLGNGSYKLHAIASDPTGQSTDLGTVAISVDNAKSTAPFGTIDTPAPGATISGTAYVNFGWVLTPPPNTVPLDGSTIEVYIDNLPVGRPVYNNYRVDIATLFPGYNNAGVVGMPADGGAIGYFYIDTTKLTNGLHTISWVGRDNSGNAAGMGSRYFTVQN